jgi:nicotinate phosphoribosyltransferase
MTGPDPNDDGLLSAAETSLLTDLYELNMAAGYHREGHDETAIFELFVRKLPPRRDWLVCAGLGPTLRLLTEMRFGPRELEYLSTRGFEPSFLDRLAVFRFSGDVDAMPEGTLAFAGEPLLRVTAPRIEAQLIETILLNQINFQTMAATKAARVVLAAGGGEPGHGDRVVDYSPRRDHGVDAAMKVARSSAVAGCAGTSNVAAAMRYGLTPLGTMAHSFVLSFPDERAAFESYLRAFPENTTLLVDTYDVEEGVRNAIAASQATGIRLGGVRIDSGELEPLAHRARELLDEAGMRDSEITVSGDLEEVLIAELVASGAPIDRFGVGTDLGTSRDSPTVNGIYKLVADLGGDGWRGVRKLSAQKETLPGPKQVWRRIEGGVMRGDTIAPEGEAAEGEPLLVPVMRGGEVAREESLAEIAGRTNAGLSSLPPELRAAEPGGDTPPYPVAFSPSFSAAS